MSSTFAPDAKAIFLLGIAQCDTGNVNSILSILDLRRSNSYKKTVITSQYNLLLPGFGKRQCGPWTECRYRTHFNCLNDNNLHRRRMGLKTRVNFFVYFFLEQTYAVSYRNMEKSHSSIIRYIGPKSKVDFWPQKHKFLTYDLRHSNSYQMIVIRPQYNLLLPGFGKRQRGPGTGCRYRTHFSCLNDNICRRRMGIKNWWISL